MALWPITVALVLLIIADGQAQPAIVTKPHRNVCTLPYASMDICGAVNGTVANFTGYELEVSPP